MNLIKQTLGRNVSHLSGVATYRLVCIAFVLATMLLSGCALTTEERFLAMKQDGGTQGFTPVSFGAAPPLVGMLRAQKSTQNAPDNLWVVIEGDGRAWLNMREPSFDPTPVDAAGWRLAKGISKSTVLYLARPCQYISQVELDACSIDDWTSARFAEKWVGRLNAAINEAKRTTRAKNIVLAGYSGGGVMAALIAARRDDVAMLITVASPLDHAAWTTYHRVSPLTGSLNALEVRERLFRLPQIHVVGDDDKVVPPVLLQNFLRAYPTDAPAELVILPGVDHRMRTPIDLSRIRSSRSLLPSIDGRDTYP
ncbi:alpha/beta hydrolase [Herminiimonas arsenitoxidans]|uniref:alpha/beta hydrolase n=1 Tax=Herminiimonas arsenitoxidans TaxID=1809410 RepID=UPI0012FF93E5|nr:alpha/beta hydrolase [Herminiimonas arsenitoxidans]